ncbi:ParB N-terminal domain-containing protein [Polyangium jinanense]|nr:ParB N-terminal domain-containing protein [Polyangium jinanense]
MQMKDRKNGSRSTTRMSSQCHEDVRELPLVDIVVPKHRARRLRDVTPLVESIAQSDLIEPIIVRRLQDGNLVLVAGLHRLEAHRKLHRKTILARIIEVSDLEAELIELDENLARTELTVLERSEQLLRRKQIYERLHPETKQGGAPGKKGGGKKAKDATVASFAEDASAKTSLSIRTIQDDVKIARLGDNTKEALRGTPLEDQKRVLLQITRIAPEMQAAVAEAVASGRCRTVKQAVIELGVKEKPQPRHPRGGIASLVRGVVEPLLDAKKRLARLAAGLDTASAQEAQALGEEISAVEKKLGALASSVEARTVVTRDAQVQGQQELPLQRPDTPRVDVLGAVQALLELESEGILKAPPMTFMDVFFADPTDPHGLRRQLAEVRGMIQTRAARGSRGSRRGRGVVPANDVVDQGHGRLLSYKTYNTIQRYLERHEPTLEPIYNKYAETRTENSAHARICEKIDRFLENGGIEIIDNSFSYVHYLKVHCADPQALQVAARAMEQETVAYLRALNQFSDKVLQSMRHSTMKQGSAPAAAPGHASQLPFTQSPKQPEGPVPPFPSTQVLLSPALAPAANTQASPPSIPVLITASAAPDKPRECPTDERIEEEVSQLIDDLQSGRLRHSFEAEKAIRQKKWPQPEKDKALKSFFKRRGKLPPSGRTTMPSQSLPADSTVPAAGPAPTSASLTPPVSYQPCRKDVETGVLSRVAALLESAPPDVLQQAMSLASAVR